MLKRCRTSDLARIHLWRGDSVVELMRIELTTPSMPWK